MCQEFVREQFSLRTCSFSVPNKLFYKVVSLHLSHKSDYFLPTICLEIWVSLPLQRKDCSFRFYIKISLASFRVLKPPPELVH